MAPLQQSTSSNIVPTMRAVWHAARPVGRLFSRCIQPDFIRAILRLLFLYPSRFAIVLDALSWYRGLGEDSRRKERKYGKLRAGDEASIGEAGSGHGRTDGLYASSSHGVVMLGRCVTWIGRSKKLRWKLRLWHERLAALTSETLYSPRPGNNTTIKLRTKYEDTYTSRTRHFVIAEITLLNRTKSLPLSTTTSLTSTPPHPHNVLPRSSLRRSK